MGTTRAKYNNGIVGWYDNSTYETMLNTGSVKFEDDFIGKLTNTTHTWTAIDVSAAGLTTPVLVANAANGIISLPLDSTSEAQEAGLTWGDVRTLGINLGPIFECRLALATLPTTGVKAVWGFAANKNATADSVTENFWFCADASGAVVAESDDTATDNDDKSTGVTLTAGTYAIFRIDATVSTDVKFYINGARVATSTTFTAAGASATLALQPYFHIAKASGTGVGEIKLDYVRCWQKRS